MITIVDTDALFGTVTVNDLHHGKAVSLLEELVTVGADSIILPTTMSEFALIATSRIGVPQTKRAVSQFMKSGYNIMRIDEQMTEEATALYQMQTSKEESLFDCFVMTAARKLSADCIFSFDRGYTKNGFLLVEDFLKQR